MFQFLLVFALVVAAILLYYFLKMGNNDKDIIITKLEHLNESGLDSMEENEFKCELRHTGGDLDELDAHPIGPKSDTRIGIVPYEHKGRILHFMNTKYLHYEASFNKENKKLTIDLIDELADKG